MTNPEITNNEKSALIDAFRQRFPDLPLLQSGHILKATEIAKPQNLDPVQLASLRLMGHTLCEVYPPIYAVAYTELMPAVYDFFEVDRRLNNIVYLNHNIQRDLPFIRTEDERLISLSGGSLLISPKLVVPTATKRFLGYEGCGSIEAMRLHMFVERPTRVKMDAYIYNPSINIKLATSMKIGNTQESAAYMHHEFDHLQGLDATNSKYARILDPWIDDSPFWQIRGKKVDLDMLSSVEWYRKRGSNEWLVKRDKQLIVVDSEGLFVRNFVRS